DSLCAPSPTWPSESYPQQTTAPPATIAHVCWVPAERCIAAPVLPAVAASVDGPSDDEGAAVEPQPSSDAARRTDAARMSMEWILECLRARNARGSGRGGASEAKAGSVQPQRAQRTM